MHTTTIRLTTIPFLLAVILTVTPAAYGQLPGQAYIITVNNVVSTIIEPLDAPPMPVTLTNDQGAPTETVNVATLQEVSPTSAVSAAATLVDSKESEDKSEGSASRARESWNIAVIGATGIMAGMIICGV